MADTSFSDPRRGVVDTRGCAVSSIHIHNPTWTPDGNVGVSEASYVSVEGVLKDGTEIKFDVPSPHHPTETQTQDEAVIGRLTRDGWWVKARVAASKDNAPQYVLSRGEGFTVHYRRESLDEVLKLLD